MEEIAPDIYLFKGLLSTKECTELIKFSESLGYQEAGVITDSGRIMYKNIRNNDRVSYFSEDMAADLWLHLQPVMKMPIEGLLPVGLHPELKFYRYTENQRFNMHRDGRVKVGSHQESRVTLLINLSADYLGGHTKFRKSGVEVSPEVGQALCFRHELMHSGTQVESGVKYLLRGDVLYEKTSA